jgi:hypothetical protein
MVEILGQKFYSRGICHQKNYYRAKNFWQNSSVIFFSPEGYATKKKIPEQFLGKILLGLKKKFTE